MNNFNNINNLGFDIFYEEEYWINRIYYALFGGIANERKSSSTYLVEEAVDYILTRYDLKSKPNQIRYYSHVNRNDKKIPFMVRHNKKSTDSTYSIIIREGFLLQISNRTLSILFDNTISLDEIINLEEELLKFIKIKKKKKEHFYMIIKDYDGFSLSKFKVRQTNTVIELHYNDDIKEFDLDVKDFLQDKTKSGLVLMHGMSGTGKTTYIRHLIRTVKRKFIFLPLFMAEALSSPDLLPFLTEQKNSILIIEDSEKLIANRETGNTQSDIATLLNISDGLLSDALGIKLICTFNTGLSNIDKALLRKGRMANRYEFTELTIEKAQKIALANNLPYKGDKPITIGDLFNIEKENNANSINRKRMGFNN